MIELVIKIDEDDYEIMKHNIAVNNPLCPLSQEEMMSKVVNGTPLPKGHGDLVDVDVLKEAEQTYSCDYEPDGFSHVVEIKDINDAPVIIKADKESEYENSKICNL